VQCSRVEASAGATNWYGSGRQTTGYSDALARGGDWAHSEPTPQLAITGSRADSFEASSTESRLSPIRSVGWDTGSAHSAHLCRSPELSVPPVRPSVRRRRDNPAGRQQIPHFANHFLQLLGFENMILLRTGGLAASPPVRYTLETAEQCLVATVALGRIG
jgi:hypothetical protein